MTAAAAQARTANFTSLSVGRVLSAAMERANVNQTQMGSMMRPPVHGSYISMLLSGRRGQRPSRVRLLALAEALAMDPYPLLEAAGRVEPGDSPWLAHLPPLATVVEADTRLDRAGKDALLAVYRALTGA